MQSGIESLGTIRSQLQGRDDVLTRSLELLEREREIVRRELGLVEELVTAEQQRVAMQVATVPTAEATPEPEPVVETEPEPVRTAQVEPEPALMAEAVSVMVAESMFGAQPDLVPPVETAPELNSAEASNALRLQREERLQRFRESLATPLPDPVTPKAADASLFQGVWRR
ncbi:MAG: hypothetical protein ACLQBX_13650 [Candidatus Limnocylindrales bacterium]